MESEQLFKWCDDKGINAKNSIVLNGVSLKVTDEDIYKVLDLAKIFGCFKIRVCGLAHSDNKSVLIETVTDMINVPEQLVTRDQSELW